jgi:hypothetical protein
MKRIGIKAFVIMVLAAPAALIAEDKKETPEKAIENHDSKTRGAVQVKGETTDWFDVARNGKSILSVPSLLNGTVELEPGEYEIIVNRVSRKATIEVGKKVVFLTGTLQAEGKGLFYYPVIGKERKVAPNRLNPDLGKQIALFPGTYGVEIDVNLRKIVRLTDEAKIEAGKKTIVKQ